MNLSKKQIYLRTGVIVLLLILEIFSCVTLLMVITALESVIFKHHYGNINKQQILALGT